LPALVTGAPVRLAAIVLSEESEPMVARISSHIPATLPVDTPPQPMLPAKPVLTPARDRRDVNLGPPPRTRERRVRHKTPSGLVATDGLKMACPCCGGSESAVVRRLAGDAKCPQCGQVRSEVVKVRGLIEEDAIRRRRECVCGFRFPTHETIDWARLEQEMAAHGIDVEKFKTAP
jgi:hypothetical protein